VSPQHNSTPMSIKPIFLFFLLALCLTQPSCKKEAQGYEVSYIYDFQIPAGTGFYFEQKNTMSSLRDSWLAQHNISRDDIKSVQVRYVKYAILNSNDDFSWADKAYLKIAKADTNPNPTYFEIGFNLQIPNNQGGTLDLAPDETQLKDYFLADQFKLNTKFINKINAITPTTLQVRMSLGLTIFKN
jgi:hypothetical protein